MKLACIEAGQLMQRRAQGLSAPEGLRLEDHLSRCSRCRGEANLLVGLAQLQTRTCSPLSAAARTRAIGAAFASASHAHGKRTHLVHRPALALLSAAALVALASLIGLRYRRTPHEQTAVATPSRPGDRVLSGQLDFAGQPQHAGDALSASADLQTRTGARVALAHAQVELRPDTGAHWDGGSRTLSLRRGSLLAEVDPAQHKSFAVETDAFTVHVLGTRFEVTQTSVHVLRGRVSVQPKAADGDVHPVFLEGGSTHSDFELQPAAAQATPHAAAAPAPDAARATEPATGQATRGRGRGEELLERARTQLAARQLVQARRTLKLALPRLRSPALRAEASSLAADCHLMAKHYDAARNAYLRVARQYAALPAAETALFAAARVEAEHGDPDAARALLSRYLTRYPNGSFVREALRRRELLGQTQPAEHGQ